MKTSEQRILTTHVGSLPRTEAVVRLLEAREGRAALRRRGIRPDNPAGGARYRQAASRDRRRHRQRRRDQQDQLRDLCARPARRLLGGGDARAAKAAPRCRAVSRVSQKDGAVYRRAALQARHLRRPDQSPESRGTGARPRQHARRGRRGEAGRGDFSTPLRPAWSRAFCPTAIIRRTRPISRPSPTRCRRNMRPSRPRALFFSSIAPISPCRATPAFRI